MSSKNHDPKAKMSQMASSSTRERRSASRMASDQLNLTKAYDPTLVEDRIYRQWEESGAFRADVNSKKEPFTVSMPPPNATGQLHLGHAVMLALEDIFCRFQRMQGKEVLWVPGTDHAAIATENVVIKQLKEGGMKDPRKELGREGLIKKIADFVERSKATIRSQVRKMGSSCDWSRERYTFEPSLNRCVNEVFAAMYEDGLIYRGHRIINWDPKLQTTVSDDELVYKEETGVFYTFKYGPFQIGTARPETKFGDKYVVMHPDDPRYSSYKHGDTFECEWINGPVTATIIKDTAIDMSFGTGVMTITPWHDHTDFEIAERHSLEKQQIIGFDGKLLDVAGEFSGMKIDDARPLIVEKLKSKGLLVKVEDGYVHNKATSQRGGGAIEPQIKLQWFIDVNKPVITWKGKPQSLKAIMQDVIASGLIGIIPDRFGKTYFHWIDNLRDWCISRQIWWGHRIPVWYCTHCEPGFAGRITGSDDEIPDMYKNIKKFHHESVDTESGAFRGINVSVVPPQQCRDCPCQTLNQDNDTLDTWFSSALWTWSTLVDPALAADPKLTLADILRQSPDFQMFHPTSVMETGYDILFFWVARMILMTTYTLSRFGIGKDELERIPFKTVYLHGLVRTREGKKMSKSDPATCIDPLEIIPEFGADALRLSMIVGQSPGNDFRLYKEKIGGYRNFINKLWNAARFVLMQCEQAKINPADITDYEPRSLADRALCHEVASLVTDVTAGLTDYRLSEAGDRLYSFTWDFFCDWYLELSKGESNPELLVTTMRLLLTLLHPYCPFVTEELWSAFKPKGKGMLIHETWPTVSISEFSTDRQHLQIIIDIIAAIRRLRTEQSVDPTKTVSVKIVTQEWVKLIESQVAHIHRLCKVESLTVETDASSKREHSASAFLTGIEVHLSLEGLIDTEAEIAKLTKEQEKLAAFVECLKAKLSNEQFVAHAPPEVIERERGKLSETEEKLKKLGERIAALFENQRSVQPAI